VASQGPGVEVIVVDGCSTDETLRVLQQDRQLIDVLIVEPDEGQADAINKGVNAARGEWVCFLGADDLLLPGAVNAVLEQVAAADGPVDVVFGDLLHVDAADQVIDCQLVLPRPIAFFHFNAMQIHNQTAFMRRELFLSLGGVDKDLQFCLDYELFMRMILAKVAFKKVPRFLGAQRVHMETKTTNLQAVHDREKRAIQNRHFGLSAAAMRVVSPRLGRIVRGLYFASKGRFWYLNRHVESKRERRCQ
jgi:glycosyltransferase involved in cell wall biosynthesis